MEQITSWSLLPVEASALLTVIRDACAFHMSKDAAMDILLVSVCVLCSLPPPTLGLSFRLEGFQEEELKKKTP